jgi:tRNA pseudouridine-54 N-methylase
LVVETQRSILTISSLKEHGKFLDLMCGDVDSAWFASIPTETDVYYFVVRNTNSDYSNIKFPLEKIIKMLNFEDKI